MTNESLKTMQIRSIYKCSCESILLLCVMLWLLVGCSTTTSDAEDTARVEPAYVMVDTRMAGASATLNSDATDYEDKVTSLRLLLFKHTTGELVYNVKYDDIAGQTAYHKVMEVKTGSYDLYAVANETPEMREPLEQVRFVDALYQATALTQIAYDYDALNTTLPANRRPFLMTAIVTNQVVAPQHTQSNPLPIAVELQRVLAKATINMAFENPTQKELAKGMTLQKVVLKNVPEYYALFPPRTSYAGALATDAPTVFLNVTERSLEDAPSQQIVKTIYLPEYLCAATRTQAEAMSLEFHYNKHGIYKTQSLTIDHLQALSTPVPLLRYSVVRNHDYTLSVNLKGWEEELLSYAWKVLPWTRVTSSKSFADITVENTTTISTGANPGITVDPARSNIVRMHAGITDAMTFKFDIKNPIGAVWRFSIDNALDFKLEVKDRNNNLIYANNTGVILQNEATLEAVPSEVYVTVTALKPYNGSTRSTELYLTVNGTEVQIVPDFRSEQVESGPTKRYLIQQTL